MTSPRDDILAKINATLTDCDRETPSVRLMAVSKTQSPADILPLLQEGQRLFGENRVQEAAEKWPDLKKDYPDIELHMIGHLQSNKAGEAVTLFDAIQSLDRPKLAKALAAEMTKQGKHIPCFIQVNTGEEPQKGGILPQDLKTFYTEATQTHGLNITGLMCIPPAEEHPAPHFAFLHKLGKELELEELSMGMSGDYETAIRYGSTCVRVGTALFGTRK